MQFCIRPDGMRGDPGQKNLECAWFLFGHALSPSGAADSNATRIPPSPVWRIGGLDGWRAEGLEESGRDREGVWKGSRRVWAGLEGFGEDLEKFGDLGTV